MFLGITPCPQHDIIKHLQKNVAFVETLIEKAFAELFSNQNQFKIREQRIMKMTNLYSVYLDVSALSV